MSCSDEKINIEIDDIDRKMGKRLTSINDEENIISSAFSDYIANICDICDGTRDVRCRSHRDQLGSCDLLFQIGEIESSIWRHSDPSDLEIQCARDELPWHDIRMMIEERKYDDISTLYHSTISE